MKFRMFTAALTGRKIAVNIDSVLYVKEQSDGVTLIEIGNQKVMQQIFIEVSEPFDIVFSRLNTIAE